MEKDKIEGMFLGVIIGDCLGMPVETWNAEKIAEKYGRVTDYQVPDGHKWFNGHLAGTYTDDTQLTLAVAEALIENPLCMDSQTKHHINAFKETTAGWGNTTRDSVRRLANGANWNVSGNDAGVGNGVAMKIAPMGAYLLSVHESTNADKTAMAEAIDFVTKINLMTHRSSVSASASLAHAFGIYYCLSVKPADFDIDKFKNMILKSSKIGRQMFVETLNDDITSRFESLFENQYDAQKLIEEFGGGSCYCYNSVPFTYGFFLQNPHSVESLYDVINAGGDTDSNGSMLGALLGALHGTSIFPQHLIDGLVEREKVLEVAQRFAEKFAD